MSTAIDKLKQLLGEAEEADAFAATFSGLRPGGLPTTPLVWPVDSHVPTQIQQIKGSAPAQQSNVFPTTQPSRPTVAPKTTPGMVSNVRVLTKTVQTEYGEKKQVTVQFTHPPNDNYFTGANVYLHKKGAQPTVVASGSKSPLQFTTDISSAPHVVRVTSVGNWGETNVLSSPSAPVSLISRPSGAGTTTPPNGGLAYPAGGSPGSGYRGAWAASTTYGYGAIVNYGGTVYTSLTLANTNNNPATSPSQWQTVGATSLFLGDWNSGTAYVTGNQVIDATGGGGYYIAIAPSTNEQPSVSPSYWQEITAGNLNSFAGTYNGSTAYTVGQIVEYAGAQYVCISPTTGNTPSSSSSYWTLLGANALFMGTWSSGTAYTPNMLVVYNNNMYQAILAGTNFEPDTHPSYWQLTGPATLDDLANGDFYVKGVLYTGQACAIPNPNFALTDTGGTGAAGWTYPSNVSLTAAQSGNPPVTGGTYCEIGTSVQYAGITSVPQFKASPGDIVLFSAYMISDGTFAIYGQLNVYNGTGTALNYYQIGFITTNSWGLYENAFTMPADTAYFTVGFYRGDTNGGNHSAWVTDVSVVCSSGVAPGGASSLLNGQGNIPAAGFIAPFTENTGYNSSQTDCVTVMTWSAFTIYLADGSTISVPAASTQFPIPSAPTLSAGSGSISAGTWYAAVGIVYKIAGAYYICSISPQASITLTSSQSLIIHSPSSVTGAVGWVPLVNTTTGVLSLQSAYVSGTQITSYVAFGTNVTTTTQGTYGNLTEISSYSTATGLSGFWFFGEATGTEYYVYPAWNVAEADITLTAALATSTSQTAAIAQSGDGNIAMSVGSISWTTPSTSGGASASKGGSGGGRGLL
jgi:hypothetical protein